MNTLPGLSLKKNFAWTFTGNLVYNACQWLLVVLLARLADPETVGRFSLGLAIGAPVAYFCNLQLRVVLVTDQDNPRPFGLYLTLRLLTALLVIVVVAGIAAVSGLGRETAAVVLAVGLAKAIETVCDIFYGLQQRHERMDRIATSMVARGVAGLSAVAALWLATGNLSLALLGMAATWLAVLLLHDLPRGRSLLAERGAARELNLVRDFGQLASTVTLSLPLGIAGGLMLLSGNVPRYFISGLMGEGALGIFAALAYLMMIGNLVINALGQSAIPRLSRLYHDRRRGAFAKLWAKLIGIGILIGLAGTAVAALVGRPLLRLLYGPEYADEDGLLLWLMVNLGVAAIASFSSFVMTAQRAFKIQPLIFATRVAVTVVASIVLLPRFGLTGAAWTLIAGNTVQFAIVAVVILRGLRGDRSMDLSRATGTDL